MMAGRNIQNACVPFWDSFRQVSNNGKQIQSNLTNISYKYSETTQHCVVWKKRLT
jgi:hypothetical protein